MLIEGGFLSNPNDSRRVASVPYRQSMAQSIASAVAAYRAAVGSPGPLFAGKLSPSFNVRDELGENPAPSVDNSIPSNPNATPLVITPTAN